MNLTPFLHPPQGLWSTWMKIMGFNYNFRSSNLYRIFMQKRTEEKLSQSSRSKLKRQKSQLPQQMSSSSSYSINVGQNSDQRIIHQVNFQFDTLDNRNPKVNEANKIHSKQGTKRIGGKVVMPAKRQRKEKKENLSQKARQSLEIKDLQHQSFISKDSTQVVLLQIKSCKIEKEAAPQSTNRFGKHTRYSSNIDSSKNTIEDQDTIHLNPTKTQPTSTDKLFKAVNRKMMQEQELNKVKKTNKNCFFLNLKKKLQKVINRIEKQSERTEAKFLIEGCEIKKHRRDANTKCSLTERTRPRTAISSAKTELLRNTLNDRSRPMSCRSRSPIHSIPLKMIKEQSLKILNKDQPKRQRNTVKEKECENKYIMNNLITFDNSSTLKQYKSQNKESTAMSKTSLNCQQQNDKLNKILIECQTLETNTSSLNSKMKTFEYYCKKIDIGMQKAGHRLSDLNYAIQHEDD